MIRVVLAVGFVLAVAACGSDSGLEGASTDPVVVTGTNSETALLSGITVASGDGVDTITFTFANDVPGYDVRYVERPLVQDGSGAEVEIAGTDVLRVRMEPALDADLTKEAAPRTYRGPARFSPDADVVEELARTGGFEAVLTWAVGLRDKAPFKVSTASDPSRLVIEVDAGS